MRGMFGIVGLLVVVAIVGVIAKKQLTSGPAPASTGTAGVAVPTGTPKQQVDQFKQNLDQQMQQARPAADEAK